jgi:acyl dehydratase
MTPLTPIHYRRRPSTLAFMARATYPSALRRPGRFPTLAAAWSGHRIAARELDSFQALTGLDAGSAVPMLFPQVLGFPLQMTILTRPALPLGIWGALQVRAHLAQYRPIARADTVDLACRVAGDRILDKGAELDLHSTVHVQGDLRWESLTTFYYRGRFGAPEAAAPLAVAPQVNGAAALRWRAPPSGGIAFGRLSGDYNGIHLFNWYARLLGFPRAFVHPPVLLGQALARLPGLQGAEAGRLDAWMKGPIPYGADLALHWSAGAEARNFAVVAGTETRPALVGRWSSAPPTGLAEAAR